MSTVRTATLVASVAILAAFLLAVTAPPRPSSSAKFTALVLPAEALPGERLNVRGSVLLPDEGVLDRRLRVCRRDTGHCAPTGLGSITGPDEWSGYAGQLAAVEPGAYRVIWTLHAPWGTDSARAVVRAEAEVTIRAPVD